MKMIAHLTDFLIRKGYIDPEDRDIYLYGFDIIFYTIWSTVVLLLIGLILRQFWAAVIIVLLFYTFQSLGGGYHADTHLKCLLTMVIGLCLGLSCVFIRSYHTILWIMMALGASLLLLFPLVLHPNKAYLEKDRRPLSIRSAVVTVFILAVVIICNLFWSSLLYAFSAAFLLAGISRIGGKLFNKEKATL